MFKLLKQIRCSMIKVDLKKIPQIKISSCSKEWIILTPIHILLNNIIHTRYTSIFIFNYVQHLNSCSLYIFNHCLIISIPLSPN